MGPCRFQKIDSLKNGPPVHHQIECSSTENLYWSLVYIIHDKPTQWNTKDLIKTGRLSIVTVWYNGKGTVLLQ